MDKDELQKKIREAAAEGRIEYCSREGIDVFEGLSDRFLHVIGHSAAWISDESSLSDFRMNDEETYALIEAEFGVDVRGKDNLLEIFRAIDAGRPVIQ